jgi:hypothetical protein
VQLGSDRQTDEPAPEAAQPAPRSAYSEPTLERLGTVTDLTATIKPGGPADGGGGGSFLGD